METTYYTSRLSEVEIEELNEIYKKNLTPEWSNYNIPSDILIGLKELFANQNKDALIEQGIIRPKPQKAPPPRYIKNGLNFIEVLDTWTSANEDITLQNDFEFFVQISNNKAYIKVSAIKSGYEILDSQLEDILHDAPDLQSPPARNLLIRLKIKTNGVNNNKEFFLEDNPTFVSFAPLRDTYLPSTFLEIVRDQSKTFDMYKLK